MDLYISALLLGAVGLLTMAMGGLGRHGHGGKTHGPGTTAGSGTAHGGTHGHGHAVAHHAHSAPLKGGHFAGASLLARSTWFLTSPRVLFSFFLGFGTTGQLLKGQLGGLLLPAAALVGGIVFERLLVSPIWNFTLRFASRPAQTLESAVLEEARAVTTFDANGEGIISLVIDGQVVQLLARLQPADRIPGSKVHPGQRLRIEEVHPAKNRCTVSVL